MLDTTTPKDEAAGTPGAPAASPVHPEAGPAVAALFDSPLPGWKPPPAVAPLGEAAALSSAPPSALRGASPAPPAGAPPSALGNTPPSALGNTPPSAPAIVKGRLKGIAIVGSHPASVMAAPYHDEGFLIYACSPDNTPYGHEKNRRTLPRFDQWFEVHAPLEDPTRPFGYLHYVSQLPFVWMRDRRAVGTGLFKGARRYPEKQLVGTCTIQNRKVKVADGVWHEKQVAIPNGDGRFNARMFTSSIAYMMAKAIVDIQEMVKDGRMGGNGILPMLGLWGILQSAEGEYAYQRPGTQYFLDEAMQAGIRMLVDPSSCLFDAPEPRW